MKFNLNHDPAKKTLSVPCAALQLAGFDEQSELALHVEKGCILLLPREMTAVEQLETLRLMTEVSTALLVALAARSIKERGILRTEDAYSFKTIADICQKCFGKDANYRIQRSFFHVADDRMLWCPKLAIELPDGLKVAQSRGWINELSADWNVIIEHNDSGATPVKHPDKPRYTFAKSKDERGEDAYRFIGIFEWSETTPSGEHIYKRMASDMKLK